MFRINREANCINKLEATSFSQLGFSERYHLQEWLEKEPTALGENLLIIQKEFADFDDTRERLDLLAIDKNGNLVIIENKLDDSGRDVVWQALKYASYCSTLSKSQIVEIFQKYLDRSSSDQDAKTLITEFLEKDDFSDIILNTGHGQRLILVAAQFRKEVTSTVLWLLQHQILVKCFRATPFRNGNEILLSMEQVIPLPVAEEFMIGMSEKEDEEQAASRQQAKRHQLRLDFWREALEKLRARGVSGFRNISPRTDSFIDVTSGLSGLHYTLVFTRNEARVQFAVFTNSAEINKALFDHLYKHRERIEHAFGAQLLWRRLDDKRVSLIAYASSFEGHNQDCWPTIIEWLVEYVQKLQAAFSKELPELQELLTSLLDKPVELDMGIST